MVSRHGPVRFATKPFAAQSKGSSGASTDGAGSDERISLAAPVSSYLNDGLAIRAAGLGALNCDGGLASS